MTLDRSMVRLPYIFFVSNSKSYADLSIGSVLVFGLNSRMSLGLSVIRLFGSRVSAMLAAKKHKAI